MAMPLPLNRRATGTALGVVAALLAVLVTLLWFRQVNLVALPGDRTIFVLGWVLAAALGFGALVLGVRWFGGIPAVLAILLGGGLPFTVYISPQQVADNPIAVGDTIPAFVLLDDTGKRFNSNVLAGKPALIKFFRGHW